MTDMEDIKKDIAEIRSDVREMMASMQTLQTSRAVADERQIETSKKIDMLHLTMSNNYVSAVEFGGFKNTVGMRDKSIDASLASLQNWQTWALRGVIVSALGILIGVLRLKGGI